MSFYDTSEHAERKRSRPAQGSEMSCGTTLLIALLLIPLIFGGTLFLLNEVGQAYFDTDPITLPSRIAGAINRIEITFLLPGGESEAARSLFSRADGNSEGLRPGGNPGQLAADPPGGPFQAHAAGSRTPVGSGSPAASAAGTAALSDVTASPSAATSPSATGSPTASAAPPSTATRTATSSPTHPPSSTPGATATAPPGQPAPTSSPVPATATTGSCTVTFNNGYEGTVLELINDARQDQGLPAYTTDNRLRSAALAHATDMACNDFFSHTGSDGSTPAERVSAQGYPWSSVGENIYAGSGSYGSPSSAFEGWMDSPGHRANILSTNFAQIGVGYVYFADSQYRNYYVTVFASPD